MANLKICDGCKEVVSTSEQQDNCPHDFLREQSASNLIDLREDQIKGQFHKLWSKNVGLPGYDKEQWVRLQVLLQMRGINV